MLRASFLSLLLLVTTSSQAGELLGTVWITPEYHTGNRDSLFFIPKSFDDDEIDGHYHEGVLRQEIQGTYRTEDGFYLSVTGIMTLQNDVESEVDGNLNEFYYDTLIENHEITFGKKVMAWGVGNNFRPLDVIQNENRRRLFLRSLTGVELVAWDYFLDTGAFTLAYINPVDDEENDSLNEEADSLNEKSLAMKYYHMGENSDQHVVARFSSGNSKRVELGAGFDHIVTDK
jgi:hypothetical protein